MRKRKFRIKIDGKTYVVEVEELVEEEAVVRPSIEKSKTSTTTRNVPDLSKIDSKEKGESPFLSQEIRAPMSGVIVSINCNVGDQVVVGESLLTLEAMKMENDIRSSRRGIVKEISVSVGQRVDKGDSLVVME